MIDKDKLSSDYHGLPDITYPDIVNYLVHTQSAYTLAETKALKSLESHNHFVCGWVRYVQYLSVNDRTLITAKVDHKRSDCVWGEWLYCAVVTVSLPLALVTVALSVRLSVKSMSSILM